MPVQEQFKATRPESDGKAFADYVVRKAFTYADLDASGKYFMTVGIQAVLGVRLHIVSGFTDTTAVIVGDGDTANGYLASGDVSPTTAGAFANSMSIANTYKPGKYYASGGVITVDFTGTASAGSAILEVQCAGYGAGFERGIINNS